MAVAFVGGAALGAAIGELLKVVIEQTRKTARFRSHLKRLVKTLERIGPVVEEMMKSGKQLGYPEEELEMFIDYLSKGKELVLNCPRIKIWDVKTKYVYADKLINLDAQLVRMFQIDIPAKIMSHSMRLSIKFDNLTEKMDVLSSATTRAGGFFSSCGVPGLPELIIGLDHHLAELKHRLLKDDTRALVVSAPGGSGKTTLAKMLCHDDEITEIFGNNILYAHPTELSSLSKLQTLRLHCCTKLHVLPESIGSLHDLSLIDISDCLNITALPEQIGELSGLRVLKMSGCRGLQELPISVSKLWQLEDVICDDEASYLWKT